MHMSKRCLAVLLVGALTLGLYAASLIDWDSEDMQDNPLSSTRRRRSGSGMGTNRWLTI